MRLSKLIINSLFGLVLVFALSTASLADNIVIDFNHDQDGNTLNAGDIITNQFDNWFTVSVDSYGSHDLAMIFDSYHPTGGDTDLATNNLGNLLIISEDGDSNDPDDEQAGGRIYMQFNQPVDFFTTSIVDVENGYYNWIAFNLVGGGFTWRRLSDLTSGFGDGSIVNVAFDSSQTGGVQFTGITYGFSTSAAIGGLAFQTNGVETPEPASMLLFGSGLAGIAIRRYRRRKKEAASA